ncbi:hypothetical protein ABIC98_003060 [Arthrobacter nitrophenolicus]|uniref:Uncharacterized protein n=1 Tax=Arthrobacter nitrophenolicus TaxID=683150 RepID=A0ACC6TI44_9MICC
MPADKPGIPAGSTTARTGAASQRTEPRHGG